MGLYSMDSSLFYCDLCATIIQALQVIQVQLSSKECITWIQSSINKQWRLVSQSLHC